MLSSEELSQAAAEWVARRHLPQGEHPAVVELHVSGGGIITAIVEVKTSRSLVVLSSTKENVG